ncbi:MAG TPA: hypothetical protein DDW94_02550 [Deltaproteobacteria bacterium]|nr:MAG: hypothetical protein A2Z79_09290 [Deltaproteobacteria bacterium GWA2_55_82]OGQ64726.1 MAG: hypothetical protein A3I81_07710 [Deltaproteobacteria bacterium RIFCSPLOWO2_02_FULL_55_12]OIJ73755.1 MAG: hypothetical protein A2V21_305430 [Deltaproteobacteria bacterium GWC2_55_46]HBG45847.1 hypothetical protein [Deltaproteobacteria bacterium]HCY09734.1 hypothetical protein [Deltaproteobacteria bacterium]
MADKIRFRRGNFSDLPSLSAGEPGLSLDTKKAYLGHADGNLEFQLAAGTVDYTVYAATSTFGGKSQATQGATGLQLTSGTTTGADGSKLIDSGASFTSALVDKAVYNATDDTWAKVTAVDSSTQLSLSADRFTSGEAYEIASAIDNLPEAFSTADSGFRANITIRMSPGTFADDTTFIGKTAGDNKTLTVKGSTTSTTTISGKCIFRQRLTLRNLTFTNKLNSYFGADLSWYTCVTSGISRLYMYTGATNYFESTTLTFGNDPGNYISISSTITKGYTMYVATTALGGDDSIADGLSMYSGTATSTTANKLVDSAANFGTDVVNKTVYNSTDDTWAKVTARDSATQLSLSADIMASGEAYVAANAFSTVQGGVNAIPGTVNCNTDIKISDGTFTEKVIVQGKAVTGSFTITFGGTLGASLSSGTATSAATDTWRPTLTDTGKAWTVNAYTGKILKITSGTGSGENNARLIDTNTATVLTCNGDWVTPAPTNGSGYAIYEQKTIISGGGTQSNCIELIKQSYILVKELKLISTASGGVAILARSGSTAITVDKVWVYDPGTGRVSFACRFGSQAVFRRCYADTPNVGFQVQTVSNLETYGVLSVGATVKGLLSQNNSLHGASLTPSDGGVSMRPGIFRNSAGHGIHALGLSIAQCNGVMDNNGSWGAYGEAGAWLSAASIGSYTGNGAGTYTPTTALAAGAS